ncbi:hypothetical protein N7466_002842 [Penicillium verhagenii]|uniref:uncharacterized protein n=1 Tax=Penicillium verhagenii TaxID=1562060 RepID=UPI00254502ED|nr:uncharacterized protein N7466_002842 [Penicillium verhagenii]KAJ5939708.1 hypothetical protein N7466_002842 [Penicillium verhagenii]
MVPATHFKLNTGAQIPAVGLGTWRSEPGQVRQAVSFALENGYTHIDAAFSANTSNSSSFTGQSDLSRALLPANPDGTRSIDRSWDQNETWRQMEEVYKAGKVKAIGVANWSISYLEALEKKWTVVPAVNQVELHPFLPQHALKEWCDKRGILLEAYSPLGSEGAPLLSDPAIQEIAKKNDVSAATILVSYHVNRGVVVLPKSIKESRIVSNSQVIALSSADMDALNGLAAQGKAKRINTPLFVWDLGFDDWYKQ